MEDPAIQGGCFCGTIRYQATAHPTTQAVCHCANCRRAAGAQSVAWVTLPRDTFAYLRGTPTTFRADNGAEWSFCSHCGTTLIYRNNHRPNDLDVTTGSLDNPESFPPTKDVNADERLPWVSPTSPT